ncbi:MAG: ferritin-like domain-containing protein [Gammaproteobacteria bacterium]
MIDPSQITDMQRFLALAYVLEEESADRYHELADNMDVHHHPEVAAVFRELARFGEMHAAEVAELAGASLSSQLADSSMRWELPEGPETTPYDALSYGMDVHDAYDLALHNEKRGRDFYANVAEHSPDPDIRKTAAEFAQEEAEHVALLEERMSGLGEREPKQEDWDPANMPE